MRVRRAAPADIAALVALNADVQEHHRRAEPELYVEPDPVAVAAWFEGMLATQETLLAERGDEPVGYVIFSEVRREPTAFATARAFLLVDQIGATPQRAGIGRALLDAVHAIADERGLTGVELNVRAINTSAIGFYEALGYAPVLVRMRRPSAR